MSISLTPTSQTIDSSLSSSHPESSQSSHQSLRPIFQEEKDLEFYIKHCFEALLTKESYGDLFEGKQGTYNLGNITYGLLEDMLVEPLAAERTTPFFLMFMANQGYLLCPQLEEPLSSANLFWSLNKQLFAKKHSTPNQLSKKFMETYGQEMSHLLHPLKDGEPSRELSLSLTKLYSGIQPNQDVKDFMTLACFHAIRSNYNSYTQVKFFDSQEHIMKDVNNLFGVMQYILDIGGAINVDKNSLNNAGGPSYREESPLLTKKNFPYDVSRFTESNTGAITILELMPNSQSKQLTYSFNQ